jgi:hypothetical protein
MRVREVQKRPEAGVDLLILAYDWAETFLNNRHPAAHGLFTAAGKIVTKRGIQ